MSEVRSLWKLTAAVRPMLTGRVQARRCGPHLHDTFTIAYMRWGRVRVQTRGQTCLWQEGEIFLGNPYEVHSGNSESERGVYEYDVFYPSLELMSECAALGSTHQPRFAAPILKNPALVRQLVEALSSAASEEGLRHFLRGNGHLVSAAVSEEVAPVREACSILQNSVDAPVCWPDLPRRVGCSRGHFIRLFQKVTGIAPNAYLRQLRLSKALHLICSGEQIAAAAADAGFTDQAHLTREFKRAFGRTPGKVARDLTASTHFRSLPAR